IEGVVSPVSDGDEIGMAGLDGDFEIPDVRGGHVVFDRPPQERHKPGARGAAYVVHPPSADSPRWRSAIFTDSLLMGKSEAILASLLQTQNVTDRERSDFARWLSSVDWGTYKFIDRELVITAPGNGSVVQAVSRDVADPIAAVTAPRLTLHRF